MEIINHPTPSFSPGSSSPSTSTIPAASTETIILRSYNYNHNHDNDHGKDGYSPPAKKKVPAIKRVSNWMKKRRISVPGLRLHAGRHHHYHQQQQQHHHPGQEQQQDSPPSFRNRDRGTDRDRDRDGDSDWHDDETITTSYAAFCTDFTTSNATTTSHYNNPGKESRISGPETDGRALASSAQDPDANSNTNNGANLSTPLPLPPQDVFTPSLYISSEKAKHERIPQTESGAGPKGKQERWCSVLSRRWFSFCRR